MTANSWEPSGHWKIPLHIDSEPLPASLNLAIRIPDHRGQQPFVEAAYRLEEHLARQPAHIAAQRDREFEQAASALHQR